jgi:hypothetical protein
MAVDSARWASEPPTIKPWIDASRAKFCWDDGGRAGTTGVLLGRRRGLLR